jgi:Protein of unknown function (DUF2480)
MESTFVNKVAESGIITIDLASYLPQKDIVTFDLKDYLFMGLILKEKDYRTALKELDLAPFENKIVALHCSADAIVPSWAYMLASTYLNTVTTALYFGDVQTVRQAILINNINAVNSDDFFEKRIVVKGCGDDSITSAAYLAITNKLYNVSKSIMYGEPCSTVPIYKKK